MHREFNTLLIPVESQVRELDGKLLLACTAAEKGFQCIIGSRAHIHFHSSKVKNAVYLAKSMRRFSDRMFKILNGLGHRIVAWDEEALVRLPDQQYYDHRLSPVTFKHIDHLFCWGPSDAQVFKQYPHYQNQPVHEVGNPRIDLLRPELRNYFLPERDALIKEYGNYILINTNFGQVNHFIPNVGTQEANRDKNFNTDTHDTFISQRHSHKQSLYTYFKQLVPYLTESFPDIHFILRPHPSESVDSWQRQLNSLKNVTVCNQGNVIPWIMGARALISNGCTTSIEATILETPTLGYYPITNNIIDDELPKKLCDIADSNESLAEKLSDIFNNKAEKNTNNQSILSHHISSLNGDFSCNKIINEISENYTNTNYQHKNLFTKLPSKTHNNVRTLIKILKSRKTSSRNSVEYHKHRFPTINTEYLNEKISRLNSLTGNFSNIKINKIADDVFTINT